MATAIEFNNISKIYRLGLVGTGTLSHDLKRWWTMNVRGKEDPYLTIGETNDRSSKGNSDYVWALRDIDFKVEQGDVVGIIGKNGAGKSTLLKILSKVTAPTTGTIRARGRIGSLLEVGTGFHPEMTGRENIYMNGAILGMTKAEITKKLDEIVDFSGCERYIDTPVKRYSSGMMVRLGFAVAAHLDPEILVVDEVLAVGDAEFQKKAIGKMQDVSKGEGRTVLFVSHNMAAVRRLCQRGIVLDNGKVLYTGGVNDAVENYLQAGIEKYASVPVVDLPRIGVGTSLIRFEGIDFLDNSDHPIVPHCGGFLRIRLKVNVAKDSKGCGFSMGIYDNSGTQLMTLPTYALMEDFQMKEGCQYICCDIPRLPLTGGTYKIGLWSGINKQTADQIDSLIQLDVQDDDFFKKGRNISQGANGKVVLCDYNWLIN
jgi:lipopolysaccharide transport system ATP-binding protein